jgi:hypothetical protein
LIKEERRSKLGNEPSTGFNKCNELMLRFEGRRKRFEVRVREKLGNDPSTGFYGWMLRKKTGWGNKNE